MTTIGHSSPTIGATATAVVLRRPRSTHSRVAATVLRVLGRRDVTLVDLLGNRLLDVLEVEDETEARAEAVRDWTVCRCRIHERMNCGVDGAEGCEGMLHGKHPALVGLYDADHRVCAVEPGVRELDRRLFMLAEFGEMRRGETVDKYMRGFGTAPERMGAFFCYTHLFPACVVVRVARLLGPRPLLVRVIRYALVVGLREIQGFKVERVSNGDLHVTTTGTSVVPLLVALNLMYTLGGMDARVGTAPDDVVGLIGRPVENANADALYRTGARRAGRLLDFLLGLGIELCGDGLMADLTLVSADVAVLGSLGGAYTDRMRMFAVLGDVALKRVRAEAVMRRGGSASDYSVLVQKDTNGRMAELFRASDLVDVTDCGGMMTGTKALATMYEAIIGVVSAYGSSEQVVKFLARVEV